MFIFPRRLFEALTHRQDDGLWVCFVHFADCYAPCPDGMTPVPNCPIPTPHHANHASRITAAKLYLFFLHHRRRVVNKCVIYVIPRIPVSTLRCRCVMRGMRDWGSRLILDEKPSVYRFGLELLIANAHLS